MARSPIAYAPGSDHKLRVAIASQATLTRELLARALVPEAVLSIVGQAWDEDGISAVLWRGAPAVLLFDYEGLGPNGEGMISRLRHAFPSTRILVLATRSGADMLERVLRAGASGLLGKDLDLATFVRAIRAVAAGQVWGNRVATAQALEGLFQASAHPGSNSSLTRREVEIVVEVGRGLRNKEIARRMNISEKTVKSHLNSVFRKLQLDSRVAVALYVREHSNLSPRSNSPPTL